MCGIVGIVSFAGSAAVEGEDVICAMRDTLAHRGPDDAGLWIAKDRKIVLAHRRLAVLDLSKATHQPMSNTTKTIWLAYNGELYNAPELREELVGKGYIFQTVRSDTEVIIHAYEEWGIESVKKFNGMFAFALWDTSKKFLWLVRDHIGEKPLYYVAVNGRFIFASEIKALLRHPDVSPNLNREALYHYLSFQFVPPPATLFTHIQKLEAGTYLCVREDGPIIKKKYWDVLVAATTIYNRDSISIAEEIRVRLRESVRSRMVSDVSMGVFLSGGLDSSINAVLFSNELSKSIKTFAIGYDNEKYNELSYARMVANFIHSVHSEKIIAAEDFFSLIKSLAEHQDEPLGDPVCIPLFYLARHARSEGVTVCQVGEGSDELFFGYPSWRKISRLESFLQSPILSHSLKRSVATACSVVGRKRYNALLGRNISGQPLFWGGSELFTEEEKLNLFSPSFISGARSSSSFECIRPFFENFLSSEIEKTTVNWMSYIDLSLRIPELLLMRLDKMAMASSLEIRAPYLDHTFISFVMSLPSSLRVGNRGLKPLLKKAFESYIPKQIIQRRKQGFSVPIADWLFGEKRGYFEKRVEIFLDKTDYFNPGFIRMLFQKKDVRLWPVINFILWHEQWIE